MKCPECGNNLSTRRETYYCDRCWRYYRISELEWVDKEDK